LRTWCIWRTWCCCPFSRGADLRDDAVDRNRLAFLDRYFQERAGGRRRDLRIDLVRRNLEQRFVAIDRIPDLLDPADDGAFRD
jgi:hypothetical protein